MPSPARFPSTIPRWFLTTALLLVAITAIACGSGISAGDGPPGVGEQPDPDPTATPDSGPSPVVPELTSPSVEELAERALVHVRVLAEGLPPRISGTDGELAAAGYVADQLKSYGYVIQFQQFTAVSRPRRGEHLEVTGAGSRSVRTNIFAGSGEGDVTGPLVFVGLGREEDLPDFSLAGTVALVKRGVIPFSSKAETVFGAGADGMVVFNNAAGIFDGTLGDELNLAFDRPAADNADLFPSDHLGLYAVLDLDS